MRNKSLFASVIMMAAVMVLGIGVMMSSAADKAKTADSSSMPKLSGVAYVAGHGGHLAVLNLATGDLDRIVVGPAGGELAGQIAGLTLTAEKESGGGTHGQALVGRTLYVGMLNGHIKKVDLDSKDKTAVDLGLFGKKFCGAVNGPDGKIYFEDMSDGHVYIYDTKTDKLADSIPVGAAVCGIGWDKGDKNAFVSDMVQGKVFVLDWKTKKVVNTIDGVGTFIHQARTNNDKTELWVTAANEFTVGAKGPEPNAVAGKGKAELTIIDIKKQKIKDKIDLTDEGAFSHDLAFTPDGKYALVTARTYSDDSIMLVIDAKTHKILGQKSLCLACHEKAGVEVTIDNKSPLLCGIEVDWNAK
jgi:hypothetical protein